MAARQSSMGLVSMVLGIVGVSLSVLGCCFSALMIPGNLLSGVALLLGFLELQKINSGEVSEDGRGAAMTGAATGGIGCLMGVLWCLGITLFMVMYFALVIFAVIAGNVH